MSTLQIYLLGPQQVLQAGKPVSRFDTNKTKALLTYLAIESAVPQRREFLAGLLWPEYPNAVALRNLRLTLFRLRQTLEPAEADSHSDSPPTFIKSPDRQAIQIDREAIWTDVSEFETLIAESSRHLHPNLNECAQCTAQLEQAAAIYRGDFLEGFSLKDAYGFEEWVLLRRERLHHQMLKALDQLGSQALWKAEYAGSLAERKQALDKTCGYATQTLRMEPWRESAHQQLMRALAMGGQVQEAMTQYVACRQVLADEFGIQPDQSTIKLYQQIRGKTFDTRPVTVAASQVSLPRHNLPPQLTPLIGRAAQLERLDGLLFSYRWVTLVGEGGVGKTRLAITAAERVIEHFPDGIWFVPLAETGAEIPPGENSAISQEKIFPLLLQAIAAALRPILPGPVWNANDLFRALQSKTALLILDSFEHLSAGAEFLMDLMMHAPQIHLMVTTRQLLHFQAGYILRVDGLPVPDQENDLQAVEFPSVQLFAERVERLSGSIGLDEKSLPCVVRICQLLDGIPLAIELAAPWALKMPLEAIANGIQRDLDFLSTSMVGFPSRHRSMRAVFESSWKLLSAPEQHALAACSQMPGEFTCEQALAAFDPGFQAAPRELEILVDKFLLVRTAPGRYRLHETLRQFAAEKLDLMKLVRAR